MRKHARSTLIKGLFWIIILVFISWGVGAMLSGGSRVNAAALVDGVPITAQAYTRAYENLQRTYQQIYRGSLTPEVAAQLNLHQQALEGLVTDLLLKREAARLGLRVSDDEVRDAILNVPAFQSDGRFDRGRYLVALRSNRLTPAEFEESQRESLLVTKLQGLLSDGLTVSDREIHDRFVLDNEKINVAFVKVPYEKYASGITVPDAEVADYYEKNRERFREPERVTLTYVSYAPKDLEASVAVNDDAIKAYYETHESDFETREKVRIRQILFAIPPDADDAAKAAIRTTADGVRGEAAGGADFATLARKHSADLLSKEAGGDLGWVERGTLEAALDAAAFALEAGHVSDVLESARGLHILKIDEKQAAGTRPLADVREEIGGTLRALGADQAARDALAADLARARTGTAFEELASARGLKATVSPPVSRGQPLVGVTGSGLITTALAAEPGTVDELIGVEPPYYLFKVLEKSPSAIAPLDGVRARIVEALRLEKAKTQAHAEAESVLAAAQAAGGAAGLAAAARAKGYQTDETGPFQRSQAIPKLGAAPIKDELFMLTAASPFAAIHNFPDAAVALVLKERVAPDEASFAEKAAGLRDGAISQRRGEVLEAYRTMLRQRADVSYNPDIVAAGRS